MTEVIARVNGAVSLVNAIAIRKGSTLGIDTYVQTKMTVKEGTGIHITSENKTISSRLINKIIERMGPRKVLEKTRLELDFESDIPTGYGLKSSSAISSAVVLACSKAFGRPMNDEEVLRLGAKVSIETKVSITGAYDDACACYYGGFVVTDNYAKKIIHSEKCLNRVYAIIFIPKSRKRGNIRKLKASSSTFDQAWNLAKKSDYWNAMILNGLATSPILSSEPKIIPKLIENGALGASVSGNGPSIAAIVRNDSISKIKKVFSSLDGNTTVSEINNKKAEVHEV